MVDQKTRLRMTSISKRFGSFAALPEIDLVLNRGEVHALVGENGVGKSTLIELGRGDEANAAIAGHWQMGRTGDVSSETAECWIVFRPAC